MSFATRAGSVSIASPEGQIGDVASVNHLTDHGSGVNIAGAVAQVSTLTVASSVNGTARTIEITDPDSGAVLSTVNWTEGASDTASASALLAALKADGVAGSFATFTSAAAVVTATGRQKGEAFSFANAPATVTVATTTAAATTSEIPFGRALVFAAADPASIAEFGPGVGLAKSGGVPLSSDLFDFTYESGAVCFISISLPALGESYSLQHTMATNLTTTVDAIVTKINDLMPANRVLASNSSDDLKVDSEIAGLAFDMTIGLGSETTGAVSKTSSTQKGWGDILLGLSERVDFTEGEKYAKDQQVQYLKKGEMWVAWDTTQTTSIYDAQVLYVAIDSGNEGKVYVEADGANRFPVPLSALKFVRKSSNDAAIALLAVNL